MFRKQSELPAEAFTTKAYKKKAVKGQKSPFEDNPMFTAEEECLEDEDEYITQLRQIRFFKYFKILRPFKAWCNYIRQKKVYIAKKPLQENLSILKPCFSSALVQIRTMCIQFSEKCLCRVKEKCTYTLKEFLDTQLKQLQKREGELQKFNDSVKEVTARALRENLEYQNKHLSSNVENLGASFVGLVDQLVFNALRTLVLNSVDKLMTVFQDLVCQTPDRSLIQSWSHFSDSTRGNTLDDESSAYPLFICDLIFESKGFTCQPSEEDIQAAVDEIIINFETVMVFNPLMKDPELSALKQSRLSAPDKKVQNEPCEDVPYLKAVLDVQNKGMMKNIRESLRVAFNATNEYLQTLKDIQLLCQRDESLDRDDMWKVEHGLAFFEETLEFYHKQHKQAFTFQEKRPLGLLLVNLSPLKNLLISSTGGNLQVVRKRLTLLARQKLDILLHEVDETTHKLENPPSTTEEIPDFLVILDEADERSELLEEHQDTVCKIYKLFDKYSVSVHLEDLNVLAKLEPAMRLLHVAIAGGVADRDLNVAKFYPYLSPEIESLQEEIKKLKIRTYQQKLLESNVNSSEIHLLLDQIENCLDELQARAAVCNSYQRKLKVELTKFDDLKDIMEALQLRQCLWDSVDKWESLQAKWQQSTLKTVDLEEFSTKFNYYTTTIEELERGLPHNLLLPALKKKVDFMKQKLSEISFLCDLCVKTEHWKSLESLIGNCLNVDELTLATLETLDVFSYATKIQMCDS